MSRVTQSVPSFVDQRPICSTPFDPFLDESLQHYGKGYVCRVCACTDDRACEGGCDWTEPNLCSNCLEAPAPPLSIRQVVTVLFLIAAGVGLCAGVWFWLFQTGLLVAETARG
jgi:hypothetical protein